MHLPPRTVQNGKKILPFTLKKEHLPSLQISMTPRGLLKEIKKSFSGTSTPGMDKKVIVIPSPNIERVQKKLHVENNHIRVHLKSINRCLNKIIDRPSSLPGVRRNLTTH